MLTLHFKLDSLDISTRVAAVAWKLGKYIGGQLEGSSAILELLSELANFKKCQHPHMQSLSAEN